MRRANSVTFPVALFVCTVLAWYGVDIAQVVKSPGSAGQFLSLGLLTAVWITGAFAVIRFTQIFIWDRLVANYLGAPAPRLIQDMVAGVIMMIALSGVLTVVFGRSIEGIVTTSGLVGVVLGFSLQTIILDVFTGLAIHFDRPFSIGDWIRMYGDMDGLNARVLEINWRTTRLITDTNEMVIVPNSILGKMIFTNYNQPDLATRFEVEVCLDYSVPVERCRHVLLAATHGTEGILEEPAPLVLLGEMTDTGLKYIVRFWIKPWMPHSPTTASSMVLTNVVQNLQFAGIGQAIPKLINFDSRSIPSYSDIGHHFDRVNVLRKITLFRSLNDEEFEALAESASSQPVLQGEALIRQGDAGDSMYVLVEGLLDVYRTGEGNTETRVARIQAGRFFGEMSLLTGEPRSATIRAALNSVVLTIQKPAMVRLLENRPVLVDHLSRSLAERRLADKARESTTANSLQEQSDSLTDQFKKKILGFFRVVFDGSSKLTA